MNILVIIFIVFVIIAFILTFGMLFFVSGIGMIFNFISYLIFRNHEDCPFCHCKRAMRIIRTKDGYKKVCGRCKFCIEVEDKKYNE